MGEGAFAGTRGNGEVAPKPDIDLLRGSVTTPAPFTWS
jgi:hypothetical protein